MSLYNNAWLLNSIKLVSKGTCNLKEWLKIKIFEVPALFELLIYIIISDIYHLKHSFFGLFHPYFLHFIMFIIFFVAEFVATVRLE